MIQNSAEANGGGALHRFMGRLRSHSDIRHGSLSDSTSSSSSSTTVDLQNPQIQHQHPQQPQQSRRRTSSSFRIPSIHRNNSSRGHSRKASQSSEGSLHVRGASSSRSRRKKQQQRQRDAAAASLHLWDEAYLTLRHNPRTAGLVVAYEAIITQELPQDVRMAALGGGSCIGGSGGGGGRSLCDLNAEQRLELLSCITETGLSRCTGSIASQVDDSARAMLAFIKTAIEMTLDLYPSAVIAFAGFSTLTPLSLDSTLRKQPFKEALTHIIGRIPWYMSLAQILHIHSWNDTAQFRALETTTRDAVRSLYLRVLEFEMRCVCASAGSWNSMAKSVVGCTTTLNDLLEGIRTADRELVEQVQKFGAEDTVDELLKFERDVDLPPATIQERAPSEGAPAPGIVRTRA